ncbi:histidine kinase N-terminal domain-containing protein, partial [Klebsiella pneumoniae]|uniref:histidine kinase N-terminal domain-containing protein n=1 Tax=Klebsiella pneumoniae TaxID=573 RepID=UPI003013DCCD
AEAKGMWAGAQIRPTTGPTTLLEDVVGTFLPTRGEHPLEVAMATGHLVTGHVERQHDGSHILIEAVPVRRASRTIGVVARRSSEAG